MAKSIVLFNANKTHCIVLLLYILLLLIHSRFAMVLLRTTSLPEPVLLSTPAQHMILYNDKQSLSQNTLDCRSEIDTAHRYNHCINSENFNPYMPSVLFGTSANSAKPDQTPQNAASDQVLHCLLTEVSFKI